MSASDINYLKRQALQFLTLVLLLGVSLLAIYADQTAALPTKFGENSYTEFCQQSFLILSGLIFLAFSKRAGVLKVFAFIVANMLFIATVREFDAIQDRIFHGFWKVPAALILLNLIRLIYNNRKDALAGLIKFTRQPSYDLLLTGGTIVLFFSRIFGKGTFIKNLMEDNYQRSVKNFAEEGSELLGYAIILMAAIKFAWDLKEKAQQSK